MRGGEIAFAQNSSPGLDKYFHRRGLGSISGGRCQRGGLLAGTGRPGSGCVGGHRRHPAGAAKVGGEAAISWSGKILPALAALGVVVSFAGPAVAGDTPDVTMPAPGALGLVALAVIGAILLARRK